MEGTWDEAVRRACRLAERGLGTTSPNPVVGAVLLTLDGVVVGEGWHEQHGGPHAEVMALRDAGDRARGATAVVTLEPCRHTGRTGPCTRALIEAGVTRVVVGVADPNPTAGGGTADLRAAGVEVITDPGAAATAAAEHVNRAWLTAVRTGRPHVTLKSATTLDGRAAAADGSSRWITGPDARADVHALRARSDAVLVGGGTLRADDPHLAVRGCAVRRQPLRVVLDTGGRIAPDARVLDDSAPTLVVVADDLDAAARERVRSAGAELLALPRDGSGLDLVGLLHALHERGSRAVLVEGGPTLAGAMVARGLVDEVVTYLAPALLGEGPSALGPAGITTISEALRLTPFDVTTLGDDVRISARVRRERS